MTRALLWIIAVLTGCIVVVSIARAHEAPSGWSYPMECCSDRDCAEMTEAQTPRPLAGGDWMLVTGEIVPRAKVKWSPDGRYHLCRSQWAIFCLFVPPQGS